MRKCRNCGEEVGTMITKCPHCSAQLSVSTEVVQEEKKPGPNIKKIILVVGGVLVLGGVIFMLLS